MKKAILATVLAAIALPAAPALANPQFGGQPYGAAMAQDRHNERMDHRMDRREDRRDDRMDRREDRRDDRFDRHHRDWRGPHGRGPVIAYDTYGRYRDPRPLTRADRIWRGRDGRYYCRRSNGSEGLIIGGAVGALLGRSVVSHQDRTIGTILGATGGALLGRSIDRGELRCR